MRPASQWNLAPRQAQALTLLADDPVGHDAVAARMGITSNTFQKTLRGVKEKAAEVGERVSTTQLVVAWDRHRRAQNENKPVEWHAV